MTSSGGNIKPKKVLQLILKTLGSHFMMDLSKNRTKFPIIFKNNWYSNWWPTKKKPSSYSGVSSESLGSHTSFWGDRHRRTGKPYGFPCPRRAEKVKSHRLSGGDQVTKINHTMRRGERRERRRRNQWRTERKQLGTWLPQDASIDGMQTVTVTDHVPIQVDSAGWGYLWSGWDGMITITIIASHRLEWSLGVLGLRWWSCIHNAYRVSATWTGKRDSETRTWWESTMRCRCRWRCPQHWAITWPLSGCCCWCGQRPAAGGGGGVAGGGGGSSASPDGDYVTNVSVTLEKYTQRFLIQIVNIGPLIRIFWMFKLLRKKLNTIFLTLLIFSSHKAMLLMRLLATSETGFLRPSTGLSLKEMIC